MKPHEILTEAKALIANPDNWVQGYMFGIRDAGGFKACNRDQHPNCFCSLGALDAVLTQHNLDGPGGVWRDCNTALCAAAVRLSDRRSRTITTFNDGNTHSSVMQMFDVAIEIAKGWETK